MTGRALMELLEAALDDVGGAMGRRVGTHNRILAVPEAHAAVGLRGAGDVRFSSQASGSLTTRGAALHSTERSVGEFLATTTAATRKSEILARARDLLRQGLPCRLDE